MRVGLLELPRLSGGSPARVAIMGLPQICMRDGLKSARRIEARGKLARERLIVRETVLSGRADGPVVKAHCIQIAVFDPRHLGLYQCEAVLEIWRAGTGPALELVLVSGQQVELMRMPAGRHGIQLRGKGQRGIEMLFRDFEIREKGWGKQPLCMSCRLDGRRILACEVTRLQLADPVSPGRVCQARGGRQVLLEPALVEFGVAE